MGIGILRLARLFPLIAATALGSCSMAPKSPLQAGDELKTWRAQYRAQHPEDRYLDDLDAQLLRAGMTRLHVLLSWGPPRYRETQPSGASEKWVYDLTEEPQTQPRKLAHLFFERRRDELVLASWRVDRGFLYFVDPAEKGRIPADIKGMPTLDPAKGRGN